MGQSLMAIRRLSIPSFHSRYFVGHGIDIGAGKDCLDKSMVEFIGIKSIDAWDIGNGDAQYMEGVEDNKYDFVHSSHCLEHLSNPETALKNWIRITKSGGYIIVAVPDEDLYEHGYWPSRFNPGHKYTFTIMKLQSWSPVSVSIVDLLGKFRGLIEIERIELIRNFHKPLHINIDQTRNHYTECAIEFVMRKM